jgi:dipeptidyl aminopeptidase/acylaminoacyl peptidase
VLPTPPALAQLPSIRAANDGNVVLEGVPEIPERIVERLLPYTNVRAAALQDWTAEGTGLYIVTRFGDVNQLHRVDMPGGARRQLTFFPEPVSEARRNPRGTDLLFSMDEAGSEFFQLFLLDPLTGGHRRLTDGRSRNTSPEWSPDGRRIAFTSTRRNGRSNDVWVLDLADSSSARLALEAPDGASWWAAGWHPEGDRLLVAQFVSVRDSRLHLLDPGSGERRRIAGSEARPANFTGVRPRFTRDGRGVFLATDARGDFLQLAHLDLASGRLEVLTRDIPWDVTAFELSPDGSRAAFVTNEGGFSRLYLMDPAAHTYRAAESLPAGVIGSVLRFSPNGGRLAFTLDTPVSPADVYTLDLGGTATGLLAAPPHGRAAGIGPAPGAGAPELVRWTFSEVGGLDPGTFVAPELVTYPTFDEEGGGPRRVPAFVYRPKGPGPHPVIVSIHGGPEAQERPGFNSLFQLWVNELGAAVIAPNVRGSAGYGKRYLELDDGERREDAVRDIGALLDWVATQPDLDTERVAVYGGSYGGYMVLASLVHHGGRLRAGVELVGISNFVTFLENTQGYRRDLRRAEYGDERDPAMREFLERVSPTRGAGRIMAPLFVAQGANDPRVPVTEAEQIVRDVRANGRDVWYMNALNEGHGFQKKENRDLFQQLMVLFFEQHLLGHGATPHSARKGGGA